MMSMTKKIPNIYRRLLLIFLVLSMTLTLSAQFGGGQGTEDDPYIISTHEHLNNINITDDHGVYRYYIYHFLQNQDIIFTEEMFQEGSIYYNEGTGWETIGKSTSRFTGQYDGAGYEIANIVINRPSNGQGLFGYGNEAVLKNIRVTNIVINSAGDSGGVIGRIDGCQVINCFSSGTITVTNRQTGGLVGYIGTGSIITDCYSSAEVRGVTRLGALVGRALGNSQINSSFSAGSVQGGSVSGGIVGFLESGTVNNSYSFAEVTVTTNQGGGVVGTAAGNSAVINSYAAGSVNGTGGGLIGQGGTATNSYWDTEATGKDNSAGGAGAMGRLTRQMIYPYGENTFTDWDFDDIWVHDEDFEHEVNPGNNEGYPYLHFQDFGPDIIIDPPVVSIEITEIDGTDRVRISWEAVENAQSYKIYAVDALTDEDWGDPIAVTDRTEYITTVNSSQFFYVVASADE